MRLEELPVEKWWADARAPMHRDEIVRFLETNREHLTDALTRMEGEKYLFRALNRWLAFLDRMAGAADRLSEHVQRHLMQVPVLRGGIANLRDLKHRLNFKELVAFAQAKVYALRRLPPCNEKAVELFEEFLDFCTAHGLDLDRHLPDARRIISEKKNQLLQHKFFQEFSKSRLEQLLATPFSFDRCIHPVLPDSAFWHRVFEYLEKQKVVDILLFDQSGTCISWKTGDKEKIAASDPFRILQRVSAIKAGGKRIFFIGHHEGYLSPYFGRSVLRKLGFGNLTENCNTVVGPRMFSNVVLRNGASNVGNLFLTLPSQKTTVVRTRGLADELRKTARKSQCLIGMPDVLLDLVQEMDHETFLAAIAGNDRGRFAQLTAGLPAADQDAVAACIRAEGFSTAMSDLDRKDFDLFKQVMREPFLLFPEGARSHIDPDGSVRMKYVNPKYFQAYFRPGDVIVPISIVGGSDIARGWRLRPATLGVSIADPIEVSREMIENYQAEGLNVMRIIAGLPNLKKVRFNQAPATDRAAACC